MNILFTNVGRRTYFIEFLVDLVEKDKNIKIHLTDCVKDTPCFWIDNRFEFHLTTPVNKNVDTYIKQIKNLIIEYQIQLVIPLSDFDVIPLSLNKEAFEKLGSTVLLPSSDIVEICMNKISFSKFCLANNIDTPKIYAGRLNSKLKFPLIRKPIYGSGSNSVNILESKICLNNLDKDKDFFLQEYINGIEYGIDILNDFEGNYVTSCIKKKIKMRGGETDKARVIINPSLTKIAKNISKSLKHIGNLDCDILENVNGKFFCIDFNPRFGGGYPWTHLSGLNYIKILIDLFNKKNISSLPKPKTITAMKGISIIKLDN